MRKSWILPLMGLGLATLTAPAQAQDITIALAGPMTGPVASIGEQMKRGAETAAAAINEAGGVNGRKIKIVVEDDACDPKQAVAVANLIVAQRAQAQGVSIGFWDYCKVGAPLTTLTIVIGVWWL